MRATVEATAAALGWSCVSGAPADGAAKDGIATDGKEGLALARRVKPDLILLDIMLPKMNGFEILKKLSEHASTKQIPVIVLTNLGGERADSDKRLALSLGAKEFLVKTFHLPDDIVGKIKTTLGTRAEAFKEKA